MENEQVPEPPADYEEFLDGIQELGFIEEYDEDLADGENQEYQFDEEDSGIFSLEEERDDVEPLNVSGLIDKE